MTHDNTNKPQNAVKSKYIKNHTISANKTFTNPFAGAKKEKTQQKKDTFIPSKQPASRYIKDTKSKSKWFNIDINNPLVCFAVCTGSFGIYILASSGLGISSGFDFLNVFCAFLLPVILYFSRNNVYFSDRMRPVYLAIEIFAVAIFISYTKNLAYLSMFKMLVYVTIPLTTSYLGYNDKALKWISYANIAISIALVVDFSAGGITGGWNPNIVGLYSLYGIAWIVFTGKERKREHLIMDVIIFSASFTQLALTNCRSAMLGLAVLVVFHYFIPVKLFLNKVFYRAMYIVIMVFPIVVVQGMLWLYESEFAHELDKWIMEKTDKSLFSGREGIWAMMYEHYMKDFFFGNGADYKNNSHSIYMLLMVTIGIVGVITFLWIFFKFFEFMHAHIEDHIVRASLVAFLAVYITHAFEPTIIVPYPMNVVYYMILAVGVGRACILDKKRKEKLLQEVSQNVQRDSADI